MTAWVLPLQIAKVPVSWSENKHVRLGPDSIMPSFSLSEIVTTLFGGGGLVAATYAYLNGRKQIEKDEKQSDVESAIKLGQNAFDISRQLQDALHKDIAELREQNKTTADTLALLIEENKKLVGENAKLMDANKLLLEENNTLLRENKKLHEEVKLLVQKVTTLGETDGS